jgi:hypothetical protein
MIFWICTKIIHNAIAFKNFLHAQSRLKFKNIEVLADPDIFLHISNCNLPFRGYIEPQLIKLIRDLAQIIAKRIRNQGRSPGMYPVGVSRKVLCDRIFYA